MNYAEWAPQPLVELHRKLTDPHRPEDIVSTLDAESLLADSLRRTDSPISEENVETMRRQLYRNAFLSPLPEEERLALLEKLIADERMKSVWATLSKRFKDEKGDPLQFYHSCQRCIAGWRGHPKQTPAEQRAFYQELYDTVAQLDGLLNRAAGFDYYSIQGLISNSSIEWLIDVLGIPNAFPSEKEMEVSYVLSTLSEIIPSLHAVLSDIGEKAIEFRDEPVAIKKPNSQNAGVHYFIKALSGYLKRRYGQPLNEVVATTASILFDLPNCDESYVRKIAKS